MELTLTKEQLDMRAFVQSFANQEIKPNVPAMEQDHFPTEIVEKMGIQGLMGIPIPEEYDGLGKDFISYIIAIHEISKVSAAVGVILSVHTSVGTNPILNFGTNAQKETYIPKLAKGNYLGAFALTEPHAGSDAAKLKLKASKTETGYELNGSKMFITNGKEADTFITFARTGEGVGAKGISAFVVEKDNPGLSIGKNEQKMGLHGTSTVMLHFDRCQLDKRQLLGNEGEGFRVAMANLNAGRIGIAAQALGIAQAAFHYISNEVKQRHNKSQNTLFRLAEMATKVEAATLLVYKAAFLMERQIPCVQEVSKAKLFTTKAAREITIDAIDLMGNDAMGEACPLARYFRDAKVTEIYEGTSEIQRIVISKHMM